MFPLRVIAMLRVWMLLCTLAWLGYLGLLAALGSAALRPYTLVPPPLLAVLGWLPVLLLWIAAGMYHSHIRAMVRERDYLVCPRCGYDLRAGDSLGSCPECGRAYTRDRLAVDWHRGGFAPRELLQHFYRRR